MERPVLRALTLALLLGTARGQGVYAPANARIVHSGQACVVKDDNLSERVYTIREGSTLLLVCLVTGHPRPQVRWTKTVGSASERLQEGSVLNETLRITAIQRGQGGRYYCKAENGVGGPAIKSIRVDVQYLDEPVLTVHQSVSDVRGENYYRERTVFLRCTVQSNPPAHFTWKRDGQPVTQRQDQGVDIYEPLYTQGETKVLKLKDLRPRDYANFTCLVSVRNVCNIPDKSASFLLKNTTAPPLVSVSVPETVVVDPGTDVEMECRVEGGDPAPQLRWSHSPGPMPPNARVRGGRLWIQAVATEQAGFYNCSAHNGVGTPARRAVELLVRTLRNGRFWITPDPFHDDEQVRLDREVKVSCQVEAVPADQLTIRWLKNGRALRPSSRIIISRHDQDFPAGVSSVDIISMRFSDSATYSCLASLNSPALPDLRLDINVSTSLMPPVLEVEQPVVEVEEGSDAELRCVVRGKPLPAVLWSRVDKERGSAPGTPEWVTGDGTLRVEGVRRDQGGTYRCRTSRDNALNVKPREASVQLNVMYPPTVEPELQDVRQRLGVSVTLACRMVSGSPLRATQADWSLGGIPLEGPSPSPGPGPDPPDRSELTLPPLTTRMYGLYQCRLSNGVGAQSCTFNLTGRSYEPEFYFDTPSPVRVQRPGRFSFLLQWTQRLPYAVTPVTSYQLEVQEEGRASVRMGAEVIAVNRTMELGALLSYTLNDLRIPNSYSVQLTPITSYGPGDSAQRILHYTHPASSLPPSGELVCGFEDQGLCGFTQDTRDDFDWTRENNVTQNPKNTPNTGPRFDNSGYYMFIEASTPRRLGDRARLSSPLYNISQKRGFRPPRTTPFCVSFYYHMYGKHVGSLNVLLRSPGVKTVERTVWTLSGNQAEEWRRGSVTINPSSPFQVVLEAVRGAGYLGDIGLDDVSITRGPCTKRPFSEKDVIPRGRSAAAPPGRPWAAGLQPLLLVALGGRALPR